MDTVRDRDYLEDLWQKVMHLGEFGVMMFQDAYNGKSVVTGHTGFKGSWLTAWLLKLGANVVGISNGIPTSPSMFEDLNLEREIEHNIVDVRDVESIYSIIDEAQLISFFIWQLKLSCRHLMNTH